MLRHSIGFGLYDLMLLPKWMNIYIYIHTHTHTTHISFGIFKTHIVKQPLSPIKNN